MKVDNPRKLKRKLTYVGLVCTYNRIDKTKTCLDQLVRFIKKNSLACKIVVVDNNSSDGTPDYLNSLGCAIDLVSTPRDMFWAESMRFGFCHLNKSYEYKSLFAFNDDIELKDQGIDAIFELNNHVIVHNFIDSKGEHSYGGFANRFGFTKLYQKPVIPVSGMVQQVYTCNMNMVVIPAKVINDVGFLADYFIHRGADTEWGIRCTSAGHKLFIPGYYLGVCDRNSDAGGPEDKGLRITERFNKLNSKKFLPVGVWVRFCRDHGGLFWWLLFFVPYLRILFR